MSSLKALLERHEGRKKKPYRCTAGKKTIGIGHNIDAKGLPEDIEAFLDEYGYITDEMIDILFDMDVEDTISDCVRLYPDFHTLSDNRMNALIDFVFNVGYKAASTFKNTNIAIRNEMWDVAADGLLASKYAQQVGKRADEIAEMLREG